MRNTLALLVASTALTATLGLPVLDDEDDDDDDRAGARNPAPSGTVAPPSNGLFGNGAAPKVQMN